MSKQYQGSVVIIKDGVVAINIPFITGEEAEQIFIDECKKHLSNFDEYTQKDIDAILTDGYEEFGSGSICISWF